MDDTRPVGQSNRVPRPTTPLLGRDGELAAVVALLVDDGVPLVTLTGPGGVGKTRLAIEVASACADRFPDGVFFVSLASIRDPDLVPSAIHKALGLTESRAGDLVSQIIMELDSQRLLVVLDNVEQVSAAAPVIGGIMAACPGLVILATSRAPLHLSGEQEYPISTLAIPAAGANPSLEQLAHSDAIRLFVERARSVKPNIALTPDNANDIAAICRQLDGLPLAIELAAARIKVLSPPAMLQRLERRLPLLTGGQRDMPERQQTMRAAIAWSYDLLEPSAQQFFRQVSVFAGGFTLDAAEAVASPDTGDALAVLEHVTSLVDQSLLRPMTGAPGADRYVMLETIREFGEEKLVEGGEAETIRSRHAAWCGAFMAWASPLIDPQVTPEILKLIEAEHANIRLALEWLLASGNQTDLLQLIGYLGWFWYAGGHLHEGHAWSARALAQGSDDVPAHIRSRAHLRAAHFALELGDPRAPHLLEQARDFARKAGEIGQEGVANLLLGMVAEDSGRYDDARALLEIARDVFAQVGDRWHQVATEYHLGLVAMGRGDVAQAAELFEAAHIEAREMGDLMISTWCLDCLIMLAVDNDDAALVRTLVRRLPEPGVATDLVQQLWQGQLVLACNLAMTLRDAPTTARMLGSLASFRHDLPLAVPEGDYVARIEARTRGALGDDAFRDEWTRGRQLSRGEFRQEFDRLRALAAAPAPPDHPENADAATRLTPREREVLALLVAGRSNREIAETLFISHRTATTHVTNILAKFGVETRAAAVTYAFTHGLA